MGILSTISASLKSIKAPAVGPLTLDPALKARLANTGASTNVQDYRSPTILPPKTPSSPIAPMVPGLSSPAQAMKTSTPQSADTVAPVAPSYSAPTTPVLKPNVTTQSGITVNPSTGGVVKAPVAPAHVNTPQEQSAINKAADDAANAGAGAQPAPTPAPTSTVPDPTTTVDTGVSEAEKAYQANLGITPEEQAAQAELDKLNESYKTGYQNIDDQTIPMQFITGQQASLEKRALNLSEPIQAKLARLQAQRQSALDASKFALTRADAHASDAKTAAKDAADRATAKAKFDEDTRRYGLDYAQKQQQIDQSKKSDEAATALANKKFEEDKRQFGLNYALEQKKVAISAANKTNTTATAAATAQSAALGGLSLVNDILKNPGAISGIIQTGIIPFTAGATTKNQYEQLKGILSLSNRQQLKGQGAVSDFEGRILDKAASDLGRNQSEEDFKNSLNKIKGVFATSAGLATPVQITDPKSGSSQIIQATRAGIEQAIKDGMTVEYK